jgi:hypothetical protein
MNSLAIFLSISQTNIFCNIHKVSAVSFCLFKTRRNLLTKLLKIKNVVYINIIFPVFLVDSFREIIE